MSDQALKDLKQAVEGLLYMSESDEPFEVFCWKHPADKCDPRMVPGVSVDKADEQTEATSVEKFFADLVEEQTWHGEAEKEDVRKYRALKETIAKHLTKTQVFRLGQVEVEIWIIGKAGPDDWIGIRTKAIET